MTPESRAQQRKYQHTHLHPEPGSPLTPTEVRVIVLAAEGNSNREIGKQLGYSEDGIKRHLLRARRRLGAVDRTHAVTLALRAGLIPCQCGKPAETQ